MSDSNKDPVNEEMRQLQNKITESENQQSPGADPVEPEAGQTEVVAPEDTAEVEQEEAQSPTLAQLLAPQGTIQMTIAPRLMVNILPVAADIPEVVRIGDTYYNTHSPLRRGKGTRDNASGPLREPVRDIIQYLGTLSGRELLILASENDQISERIDSLVDTIGQNAYDAVYGLFGESGEVRFREEEAPSFSAGDEDEPEEVDEDLEEMDDESEDDDLDNIGVTQVEATKEPVYVTRPATDMFNMEFGVTHESDEESGTIILRPTIYLTVNMPAVNGSDDILKPLNTIRGILSKAANKSGLGEDDVRVSFVFDSNNLLEPSILEMLNQASQSDDSESEAVVISTSYLEAAAADLSNDVYGLFPTGATVAAARHFLMRDAGDIMLLL